MELKTLIRIKLFRRFYLDAFCSPSAAITLARASLAASASAAIAL